MEASVSTSGVWARTSDRYPGSAAFHWSFSWARLDSVLAVEPTMAPATALRGSPSAEITSM